MFQLNIMGILLCCTCLVLISCEEEQGNKTKTSGYSNAAPSEDPFDVPEHNSDDIDAQMPKEVSNHSPETQKDLTTVSTATDEPSEIIRFYPLQNARVGEWARYRLSAARTLRYAVTEVGVERVLVEVQMFANEKPLGMSTIREADKQSDPWWELVQRVEAKREIQETELTIAGRRWQASLLEDRWTDEAIDYHRKTWVSPEAPVFGTLKMELTGDGQLEAEMELVDFQIPPQP